MSSEAMKAIFNNLTSGAGRRAEQEYNMDFATHRKADSIEVRMKSVRLSTQMHVMDRAASEAQVKTRAQEEYFRGEEHTAEC